MRLLYVGTLPPHQGGSAIVAAQVLSALSENGFQVEAIAPRPEDADARAGGAVQVRSFAMPYLDTSPDSPPSDEYRRRERESIETLVGEAVERRRPDVVLIGRESFAPHVVGLAPGIPKAALIQGATTMGILNGSYPPDKAATLLGRLRELDLVITSAEHMRRTLAELGVAGVQVVPNPVDLERFKPGGATARGDVVVAHLSNLKDLKRVEDLVDAAELALEQDPRLAFTVVGDGPRRAWAEDECAARGLVHRFHFPGWVDHARVPDLINASDMVVMPSAGEAQALVYLETAACERTLIASDIPAARELIEHGENGLLFPTGDAAGLADAILTAAGDPGLRARLGREARRRVEPHSLDRVVDAYAELLGSLAR